MRYDELETSMVDLEKLKYRPVIGFRPTNVAVMKAEIERCWRLMAEAAKEIEKHRALPK